METGYNKNVFFCAGAVDRTGNGSSEGALAAITFDRSLTLIKETVFDDYNVQGCTALRRFENSDDLLVGCFKHIMIVTWTGGDFIVNNVIEDVHTGKRNFI